MIVNFRDHHVCFLYAWFSETLNKKAVLQWTCCCGQGDFQPSDYYVCTAPLRQLCANYSGILKKIYMHTHTQTYVYFERVSLMAQLVKNLPAMWETPVQFLSQEDPLEKV